MKFKYVQITGSARGIGQLAAETLNSLVHRVVLHSRKPAAKNVPEWPAYNLSNRPTMRIDTKCEVIYDRFKGELAMWKSLGKL